MYEFLQAIQPDSTLQQMIDHFDPQFLGSTPVIRSDLFSRPASQVLLAEFFSGSFQSANIQKYPLEGIKDYKMPNSASQSKREVSTEDAPTYALKFDQTEPSNIVRILFLILLGFITFRVYSKSKK